MGVLRSVNAFVVDFVVTGKQAHCFRRVRYIGTEVSGSVKLLLRLHRRT